MLIGPSPHHCSLIGHALVHSTGYLVLALGEKTAAKSVVGSIVWALRGLKKPELSASGYALYSVCPNIFSLALEARCKIIYHELTTRNEVSS